MIEVFGVMPSCRISCTPMTAPNRHRITRKTKVAGAKVEGCCGVPAAGVGGAPPGTAVARDRSLIGMPQIAADGRLRYRMAGPVCLWFCGAGPGGASLASPAALPIIGAGRGCSSMAEQKLPKLTTRVRFPSPAPEILIVLALRKKP